MKKFVAMFLFLSFLTSALDIGIKVEKKSFVYNSLYKNIKKHLKIEDAKYKRVLYDNKKLFDFYIVVKLGKYDKDFKKQFRRQNIVFIFFDKEMEPESQNIKVDTISSSTKVRKKQSWKNISKMILKVMKKDNIKFKQA